MTKSASKCIIAPAGSLRSRDEDRFAGRQQKRDGRDNARIEDILKQLGINPVEVIVAKNGKIVSEEETAGFADELKIVRFVHGG